MNRIYPSVFLKRALLADAVVSGAAATLQLAATERLTTALELPRLLLVGTAEFMLIYAAALVYMATRQRLVAPAVKGVVFGNLLWGLAGITLLLSGGLAPNRFGTGFVLLQAFAVSVLAGLQWLGLQRSAPAGGALSAGPRDHHGPQRGRAS